MSTIARLKRRMKRAGITQDAVAAVAEVDRTMVNKVLNERAKSRRVVWTIERMLVERESGRVA